MANKKIVYKNINDSWHKFRYGVLNEAVNPDVRKQFYAMSDGIHGFDQLAKDLDERQLKSLSKKALKCLDDINK